MLGCIVTLDTIARKRALTLFTLIVMWQYLKIAGWARIGRMIYKKCHNPMATRTTNAEHPLVTILINFKLTWWFAWYWVARGIRPLFTWEKPMTFTHFISDPRKSLIEVVLV